MTKRERMFFMIWGLVAFPLIILWVIVHYKFNGDVMIGLLTYMGGVKWLLIKDADNGP